MVNPVSALNLYRSAQVRELDRVAIKDYGIPGYQLMQRAGTALFDLLHECWPGIAPVHIFCGSGNNAGDGYIVAALAMEQGVPVQVIQVGEPSKLQGDAGRAYNHAVAAGVLCVPFSECLDLSAGVIVDALLGSGLNGTVREPYAQAIGQINASQLPVVAADIPSGLCGNTGAEQGAAVHADATMCFVGLKQGLYSGRGPALTGEIFFDDLNLPASVYRQQAVESHLLDPDNLMKLLPPRPRDAHKGHFGHVMVIGGDSGMGGAVALAAEAALRCGAGLVSVATRAEHVAAILSRRPELMVHSVCSGRELDALLGRPSLLIVGPGLGCSPWSQQLLQSALNSNLPLVLDADALNLLVTSGLSLSQHSNSRVVTPHPGEAARLLSCDIATVQADRFAAVRQLASQYETVAVLKGAGSLVCAGNSVSVCAAGNPGMACGGMGDVLSGVIGALMAQGLAPFLAAQLGVYLHASAADRESERCGERGLLASDLFGALRDLVNDE